jgi:hypothetical protein
VVLEAIDFDVNAIPAHVKGLDEERLEQPVAAGDAQRQAPPGWRQAAAPVGDDVTSRRRASCFEHARHRSRRDPRKAATGVVDATRRGPRAGRKIVRT